MQFSTRYIIVFATAICAVCSTMISVSAVGLRERQQYNEALDKKKSVLLAARLMTESDSFTPQQVEEKFQSIRQVVVDLTTDEEIPADQYVEGKTEMLKAEPNAAQILEIPRQVRLFEVLENGQVSMLVMPIYGKGLWGTLYGFLALDKDLNTIRGITYYSHKETPGLGGEVDNPKWKSLWPGRKVFNDDGEIAIAVIKGNAGTVEDDPHHVDGLSGATITSRGVTEMLHFWLGEQGLGPYLKARRERSA